VIWFDFADRFAFPKKHDAERNSIMFHGFPMARIVYYLLQGTARLQKKAVLGKLYMWELLDLLILIRHGNYNLFSK
jgi:hypothetical protein